MPVSQFTQILLLPLKLACTLLALRKNTLGSDSTSSNSKSSPIVSPVPSTLHLETNKCSLGVKAFSRGVEWNTGVNNVYHRCVCSSMF